MARMKSSNLWGKIAVFLIIFGICVNTALALSGSGTEGEPWLIQSLEDFNDFTADANYWDDYTRLETDVNLAGQIYTTAVIAPDIYTGWPFQGTAFTGVFDGNNHKLINLTIDDAGAGNVYLGLFGRIVNGEVINLGLEGGSVSGDDEAIGGLLGDNSGSVSNCYSTGYVSGDWAVGGLVGHNGGSVSDCYSTGDVNGTALVGGLVGNNWYGSVSNCYSTGDVNGVDWVGGLVGYNTEGNVSNCYSTGSVSGTGEYVGGLMGGNGGIISNCYSTGYVNGIGYYVGGLVGVNDESVSNCYSIGDVSGGGWAVGGLVGRNNLSVSNSLWDTNTQTHGVTESIGDDRDTATNVEGLPTPQMQTRTTFTNADWDFINIWNIGEDQTYPYLRTVPAGDINKDKTVNFLDLCIVAEQWMNDE